VCVYKIEKFRTLSAPSEIASQFPPPLRSNNEWALLQIQSWTASKQSQGIQIAIGSGIF
jgi:hypothetical protein